MPVLVIILFLIAGIIGSSTGTFSNSAPENKSDVIVSGATGGLVKPGSEVNDTPISNQNTVRDTVTEITPSTPRTTVVTPSEVAPALPPTLNTLAAQNIDTNRALLRGEISFPGQSYSGKALFLYSDRESEVTSNAPGVLQALISARVNRSGQYSSTVTGLTDDTRYYYRICFEDTTVRCGNTLSFTTVEETFRYRSYRAPTVSTSQALAINAENATVVARYQLNDAERVQGFFVYGQSQSDVRGVPNTYDTYGDIDERGDSLQKLSVGTRLDQSATIERVIDDLEKNSTYYYSFCVAYDDDEATGITCGYPQSFTTKSRQLDDPVINSLTASVSANDATLQARINMGDYRDGYAFVVYGTSQSSIEAVSSRSRYSQIYQYGDTLQKITIDNDFDGNDTVSMVARDLIEGVQYYRFCVEYERENNYGNDVTVLLCSSVQSFSI